MLNFTTKINKIGYDGDRIRMFIFESIVSSSEYPNVSTAFGGQPLVDLPRDTDLIEYVQMQYSHDQGFLAHVNNVLEFEYINSTLEIEENVTIPNEISRRQFFQQLENHKIISKMEALAAMQTGTIPPPLQTIVDMITDEQEKFNAQMFIIGAQNFDRLHWLTDVVRQAMQWTVEQKDNFWLEASKL